MTIAPSAAAPTADGLLASLDPEQRAAAMLPDGPAQIIAPAGSGKTTTLIARLGVLLGRGVAADRIGVVTFNRDAAAELSARIARRLAPHMPGAEAIEVRTLHALARQVLLDAGRPVRLLPDSLPLLRAARRRALAARRVAPDGDDPPPEPPDPAVLDTIVSAWKIEGRTPPPAATGAMRAFQALMEARGLIDFDDLVVGAVEALEADRQLRSRWRARFSHVCVDEFQDVDAAQLRLVRLLAAPEDHLFVVGDDDQTIYAWRLADVNLSGLQSNHWNRGLGPKKREARRPIPHAGRTIPGVREFGEALLVCGSALVIHGFSFVNLVLGFRILPERLEWFAEQAGWLPMTRWQRRGSLVIALGFATMATFLMLAVLEKGPPWTLVALTELSLAATWLAYLLRRSRGNRGPR